MTKKLADQPSKNPTRKAMTVAAIAPLVTLYTQPAVEEIWPQVVPALIAGPNVTGMVSGIAGAIVGLMVAWYVPDRANVPREPEK